MLPPARDSHLRQHPSVLAARVHARNQRTREGTGRMPTARRPGVQKTRPAILAPPATIELWYYESVVDCRNCNARNTSLTGILLPRHQKWFPDFRLPTSYECRVVAGRDPGGVAAVAVDMAGAPSAAGHCQASLSTEALAVGSWDSARMAVCAFAGTFLLTPTAGISTSDDTTRRLLRRRLLPLRDHIVCTGGIGRRLHGSKACSRHCTATGDAKVAPRPTSVANLSTAGLEFEFV